jgi:hypothetical protein
VLELRNYGYLVMMLVWQIAITPTTIITMAQQQTTPTAARSNQDNSDNVSEIKPREVEIKTRKVSIDRWNNAQIAFIVLAAIAASGLVVTGIVLTSKGKKLTTVQDELSIIKDQNAAADSRAKSLLIAEAQNSAAQANEKAKQLEKQTEELKNQNLEIERRINPRFLTTAEQQTILDSIAPFRGHQIIITRLGDGEAGPYGDRIVSMFQKAGWGVQVNPVGLNSPPTYGVVCRISARPDAAVNAVLASLQKAGIKPIVQEVPTQQDSWIEMLVGLKPIN